MTRDELRAYCLSMKGASEHFPFDATTAVYKVMGKMFALLPTQGDVWISLKCDPTRAVMLRDTYSGVKPGYHLNKRHWNSVYADGDVPDDEIEEMIDHSYDLVMKGLTRAQRETLERL